MKILKSLFLTSIFLVSSFVAFSQAIVTVSPTHPLLTDSITITYASDKGNQTLMNFDSTIYMHSGLITEGSASYSDWKYAVGNWGTKDLPAAMRKIGDNRFEKRVLVSDYFHVPPTEEIKAMAFVFRNENGSKVGKTLDNKDIFVDVVIKPSSGKKKFLSNYQNHFQKGEILYIKGDTTLIKIQAFNSDIVKVSYFPDGVERADTSYSVILKSESILIKVENQPEYIDFITGSMQLRINKFPIKISYGKVNSGQKFQAFLKDEAGFFTELNYKGFRFEVQPDEAFYGSGSRATALNKRGQKFNSYNTASYGYRSGASVLNVNIPFLISSKLYGIYFENFTPGYFDIASSNSNVLEYKVETGLLSCFIINGNSFDDLLSRYTLLTGRQPLPPRWALGFIQSKYGYKTDEEALSIVDRLKSEKFPLDGLVLDLYWFGSPKTMGNLDWDTEMFKSPKTFIKKLKDNGVHLIPITETFIAKTSSSYEFLNSSKLLAKNESGNTYVLEKFWAGPSGLLDIYQPQVQEWMWKKYKKQIDLGVDGWWCDLGEPESHPIDMVHSLGSARYVHNLYSLFWAEMLARKYKEEYPSMRLFNLIRSGYAGMQRYNTFPWSGDIQRSYSGLSTQVQIMLSMGMSGVAYMHSDLGGFTGGPKNQELYTRWLQFGAFCPIMRAHGEGVPAEPVFYDEPYKSIVRDYVNLRYKLLPYNYSLSYQNTMSGIPIARPVNYYEPQTISLGNVCDEYLWGPNLLIAPVSDSAAITRKVNFPAGNWINFWNDSIYSGHSHVTVSAPLEKMPIFAKAGSIVPMTSLVSATDLYKSDSLFILVYPDKNSWKAEFSIYEDDGKNAKSITEAQYELISISAEAKNSQVDLSISKNSGSYNTAPKLRCITYCLKLQDKAPKKIEGLNGMELKIATNENEFNRTNNVAYLDAKMATLYVRFTYKGDTAQKLKIQY